MNTLTATLSIPMVGTPLRIGLVKFDRCPATLHRALADAMQEGGQ